MTRLDGKVALITGTGVGMGRAAALRFAAEGATVVGCDLNPQTSAETVRLVREAGGTMTADRSGRPVVVRGDSRLGRRRRGDVTAASTCCTTTPRCRWSAHGTT